MKNAFLSLYATGEAWYRAKTLQGVKATRQR